MYGNTAIVMKAVGKTIPQAFWDKAVDKYKGPFGMSVVDGKELKLLPLDKELMVEESLNELQEAYKDSSLIFFMADYEEGFQQDSVQPFTVLTDSKGEPILSVFLKGAFNQFVKAEGSHSPAFYAVNEFIIEELKDYFNSKCKNSINNLMQMLREDKRLRTKMEGTLSPEGFMVFMANTSEIIKLSQNMELNTFGFGWSTDTCGYAEDPAEEEVPEVLTKASILDRIKGTVQPAAKPPAVEVEAAPTTVPDTKEEQEEAEFEEVEVKVPDRQMSKNEKKDFWYAQIGFLPPDYLKVKSFIVKRYPTTGELIGENTQKLVKGKVYNNFREAMSAAAVSRSGTKNTTPHHIPTPATATAVKAPDVPAKAADTTVELSSSISTLTDRDRKAIAEQFMDGAIVKRSLDVHSQQIMDPAKMLTEMGRIKTFTEEFGIKLEDVFKWADRETLKALGRVNLDGLTLLAFQLMSTHPQFKNYIAQSRASLVKEETPKASVPATTANVTGKRKLSM